jgi:hypothetical protein
LFNSIHISLLQDGWVSHEFCNATPTGCYDYRSATISAANPEVGEINIEKFNRTVQAGISHHIPLQIPLRNQDILA